MKSGFPVFFRLLKRTVIHTKGTQARMSPKRLAVMSVFLPVLFTVQVIHWIGFFLDEIFFRGYRKVEITEPLFIVGVPRSGTTMLHRVLSRDTDRFTTFTLWELLFAPSIAERKFWFALNRLDRAVGRPFGRLVGAIERGSFKHLDNIHGISLRDPEEDFLVLVPIFACFLLILPFPFPEELWHLAYFDELTPNADKQRIMTFYKRCVQRHLYVHGTEKRFLSKNVSFSPAVDALNDTFPDCRIICNMRSPFYVIPSCLSSMTLAAAMFDNDTQGTVFRDQLLDMLRCWYKHLTSRLPCWPRNRYVFVTLDELSDNPQGVVRRLYDHFGYTMSSSFNDCLQAEHERQRGYTSNHRYSLEQFGLTADEVFEDFSYVFRRFQFDSQFQP